MEQQSSKPTNTLTPSSPGMNHPTQNQKLKPNVRYCPYEPIIERETNSNIIRVKFRERKLPPQTNLVQNLLNGFSPHLIPPYDTKDVNAWSKITTPKAQEYASTFETAQRTIEKIPNPMCNNNNNKPELQTVTSTTNNNDDEESKEETCHFYQGSDDDEPEILEILSVPNLPFTTTQNKKTGSNNGRDLSPGITDISPPLGTGPSPPDDNNDSDDEGGLVIDEGPLQITTTQDKKKDLNSVPSSTSTTLLMAHSQFVPIRPKPSNPENCERNNNCTDNKKTTYYKGHKLTPKQLRSVIALYTQPKDGLTALALKTRRLCWLCLELVPSSRLEYAKHFNKYHQVESSCHVVACPYCSQYYDFHQGINQHIIKAHFSQIPTEEDLETKRISESFLAQRAKYTNTLLSSITNNRKDQSEQIGKKNSTRNNNGGTSGEEKNSSKQCVHKGIVAPPFQYQDGYFVSTTNKQVRASVIQSMSKGEIITPIGYVAPPTNQPTRKEVALAHVIASAELNNNARDSIMVTPEVNKESAANFSMKKRILMKTMKEREQNKLEQSEPRPPPFTFSNGFQNHSVGVGVSESPASIANLMNSYGCGGLTPSSGICRKLLPATEQPTCLKCSSHFCQQQTFINKHPMGESHPMNGAMEKYFQTLEAQGLLKCNRQPVNNNNNWFCQSSPSSSSEAVVVKNPFEESPSGNSSRINYSKWFGGDAIPYSGYEQQHQHIMNKHGSRGGYNFREQPMNLRESMWFAMEPDRRQREGYNRAPSPPLMPLNMSMKRGASTWR